MKLDAKTVAALKLAGKQDAIYFDDQLAGFGYRLRAGAGGKVLRSYVAQYRRAGATRRVLLGSAEVLSAEQARAAAKKLLAKVALGEDPQRDKIARVSKDRLTVHAVVDEYLAAKQVRPKTRKEITRYLTDPGYFKPLHAMPIDTVTRRDVASQLLAIGRQRGSTTASLARAALSAFFVWCMQQGLVEANPVIGTTRTEIKARERVLDNTELAKIWKACGDDDFGRIVRLAILLGARRSEIGGMAFSEIDFERGTWTIPKARSKNDRSHTLPLMPAALEIISAVPQRASRDQLFGERHAAGFSVWALGKKQLDQKCGIAEPWVLHDIRRSVATGLGELGIQPHVIERVLGHESGHRAGVAGIYNKSSYATEVGAALALWSDHLQTIITGAERKVVPLHG